MRRYLVRAMVVVLVVAFGGLSWTASEGIADTIDSAVIGPIVLGGGARGSFAGHADGSSLPTYVINALGAGTTGTYRLAVGAADTAIGAPTTPVAVPDGCALLALIPAATTYGPPPIVRAGTRLVYFGMTASIPGTRSELVVDDNGRWVDPATGQRWGEREVPGASGAGHTVLRVGHVDDGVVQFTSRLYAWDPLTNESQFSMSWGLVSHAGCAADYWIHPQALAGLAEMDEGGVRILRLPYRLGERVFDAIRIQTASPGAFNAYVYDLSSGLLLFHGARATGAAVLTPPVGGQAGTGEGSTQLVNVWIVDAQDAAVPWQAYAPPTWVRQVQQLEYRGEMTAYTVSANPLQLPLLNQVTIDLRGSDWLHARTLTTLGSVQGMPPTQQASVESCGPASIGGLWIAPEAFAQLRPGQAIEHIAAIGVSVHVGEVGADRVTITESGPRHRIDYVYDAATGVLDAVRMSQDLTLTRLVYDLRLMQRPR